MKRTWISLHRFCSYRWMHSNAAHRKHSQHAFNTQQDPWPFLLSFSERMLSYAAWIEVADDAFIPPEDLLFCFLFRLWRFWKLHEKYRCGSDSSLTVSLSRVGAALRGAHLLCFGFIRTRIWQNDCMTSPAVLCNQTTKGRRREPSIRWRQRKRCGPVRHPPTDCGLLFLSASTWPMYD